MRTGWRVQRCELHTQLMGCIIRKEIISAAGIDRRAQLSYLQNGNKKLGHTCVQRPKVGQSLE